MKINREDRPGVRQWISEYRKREPSARMKQWRMTMTVFKMMVSAALISCATIPAAFAAWSFADQEPAAYESMYPNRDVLNGGALTPAGRMGLERAGGAAPVFAGSHANMRAVRR